MSAASTSLKSNGWIIPGLQISPKRSGWPRNQRQIEFLIQYVMEGKDCERAARAAGYSASYARTRGFELPKQLADCIAWLRDFKQNLMAERLGITAEAVLGEVAALAMVNWQDYIMPVVMHDQTVRHYGKPISELSAPLARAVKAFSTSVLYPFNAASEFKQEHAVAGLVPIVIYHYELFDRNENLIHLARHFDLFHERKKIESQAEAPQNSFRDVPAPELEDFLTGLDNLMNRRRNVVDGEFSEATTKAGQ